MHNGLEKYLPLEKMNILRKGIKYWFEQNRFDFMSFSTQNWEKNNTQCHFLL